MPRSTPNCPACARAARPVALATVLALSKGTPRWDEAFFCESASCPIVYFDETGERIETSGVSVIVFQKSHDADRPVCYCFGHSVAEVLDAERADGGNRVVDQIMAACSSGLDRCERENPQGRCCLGNVRGLVRRPVSTDCCGGSS